MGYGYEGFIGRTYRSIAVLTAFLLLFLAAYGQFWTMPPLVAGVALGLALLYGMEVFVRGVFTPQRAAKKKKGQGPAWSPVLAIALVKYPAVGLALWGATRVWALREIMVFMGGFVLIYVVIVLRAIGRHLMDQWSREPALHAGAKPKNGIPQGR